MASQYGYTALFIDQYTTYPYEYKECLRALLQADLQINRVNFVGRNALAEVLEHKHKKASRLLFGIGETLPKVPEYMIPDFLKFEDLQLELKHICREAIRKHLLKLDLHSNLFNRIPRLGLPEVLNQYLLYEVSFDDDDDYDEEEEEEKEEEEEDCCYDEYGCVVYDDDDDNDDADDYGCDDDDHDDDDNKSGDNNDDNENIFGSGSDDTDNDDNHEDDDDVNDTTGCDNGDDQTNIDNHDNSDDN